jgi:phytochrome-interacting factor 3
MTPQKKVETRKASEVAVAPSSVCSGNGAGIGNDESWRLQKRKSQTECSASQDDVSRGCEIAVEYLTAHTLYC